jgi:hypothetical protein
VHLEFGGGPLEVVGWALVMLVATLLIIPGAWAAAAMCRWFCRNLQFSDGTTAEFQGTGGEIVGWWILTLLTGGIGLHPLPFFRVWSEHGWDVCLSFLAALGFLHVLRWFVRSVHLTSGARFRFEGGYWELVGWSLINALAVITIIGWAWTAAATYRWMARNTLAPDAVLRFHGKGHQILWRVPVAILLCIPIIPIPWVWLWYTRWLCANITVDSRVGDVVYV